MNNELGVAFEFVQLPNGLVMGKYPVTQAQWELVMDSNPSEFKGPNKPVERVSWNDTQDFCQKLSEITGDFFVLPTSEEWEYACRAGSTSKFSFGDDEDQLGDYGWYWLNSNSTTHPVGEKKPNPWGLYDMHGNVWEWTASGKNAQKQEVLGGEWFEKFQFNFIRGGSWFDSSACSRPTSRLGYAPNVCQDDLGFRIIRGGSWDSYAVGCRSALRSADTPGSRDDDIGFRIIQGGGWFSYSAACHSAYRAKSTPTNLDGVIGFRLIRGGSWITSAEYCNSAYRYSGTPGNRGYDVGFRVVRGGCLSTSAEYCSSDECGWYTPGFTNYGAGFRIIKL